MLLPQRSAIHCYILTRDETSINQVQCGIRDVLGPPSTIRRVIVHILFANLTLPVRAFLIAFVTLAIDIRSPLCWRHTLFALMSYLDSTGRDQIDPNTQWSQANCH